MREMHKWKDKVELSLDNRQIFFLFFGLSVVGCFVFALGVMVGRRVDWNTSGEIAANGEASDGALALLDAETAREQLSFKDGLAVPATDGLPPTRDPDSVGLSAAQIEAAAADKPASKSASKDAALASAAPSKTGDDQDHDQGDDLDDNADKTSGKTPGKAAPKAAAKTAKLTGKFTLQMKAFATADQAETFANTLRADGHDVRVEAHEVKGRIWHRVRVGAFQDWSEGLAAKEAFEKNASVIAYVVRL